MRVTAWNNGQHTPSGTGYGLRLDLGDRDRVFQRTWANVTLDLPNGVTGLLVKLSGSFWRDCPELRSAEIGRWLIASGHRRWPRGSPPAFALTQLPRQPLQGGLIQE
jgi:hypothetical protein